eukprot:7287234-Pyramimonas_sp.AAC.1
MYAALAKETSGDITLTKKLVVDVFDIIGDRKRTRLHKEDHLADWKDTHVKRAFQQVRHLNQALRETNHPKVARSPRRSAQAYWL